MRLVAALAFFLAAGTAQAACPIELAIYREDEIGAQIEFLPNDAAFVTNTFKLVAGADLVLEGHVTWTDHVHRPIGTITHGCPEGDVTGDEIEACTMWQGVIYAGDDRGNIGLLSAEGDDAPISLILTDLGRQLRVSPLYGGSLSEVPWDIFTLSGCQE